MQNLNNVKAYPSPWIVIYAIINPKETTTMAHISTNFKRRSSIFGYSRLVTIDQVLMYWKHNNEQFSIVNRNAEFEICFCGS